jgi:2-polyprenyl-3-methyl-5-hydroxy-6-metoxy-1,4-benzoquinol methylase
MMEAVLPADYADWRQSTLGKTTERVEQDLVLSLAGSVSGKRVLDVGCGDGAYALSAAERGAQVVGVDTSRRMLDAARERAASKGLEIDLREGDVQRLPIDDASFDIVLAVTVLCIVNDATEATREMARVLSPGGRLVIGELGRFSTWAAWRRLRGWLGARTWRRARFRSAGELARLATAAGLVVERVRGAIYYPPIGGVARLFGPLDSLPGHITTFGAAFIALAARKPTDDQGAAT